MRIEMDLQQVRCRGCYTGKMSTKMGQGVTGLGHAIKGDAVARSVAKRRILV